MSPSATNSMDFKTFCNVIDGKLTSTSHTRHTLNPATLEPNPEVPLSTQGDLNTAVIAARSGFMIWKKTSSEERRSKLLAFADALEPYKEEFVSLIIAEQGKAYGVAQDEFERTLRHIRETTTWELKDEIIEDYVQENGNVARVRYLPIGVCCALVPWNYPLLLAWVKIAPAIYAGNSIIVKASPDTPMGALKIVELAMRFFPNGVIQALSGGDELGPMCTEHPGIDKISFTGSIATGKLVMASCAKSLKRCTLELGGNDAAVVCDDAVLEKVIPAIATLALLNSGQICMNIKRIYVHEKIYDNFLKALVAFLPNLKSGPATDHTNFVGPVQNRKQFAHVSTFFDEIVAKKLNVVYGGQKPSDTGKGLFIDPTVVADPPQDSKIVTEEPFGPIFPVMKWGAKGSATETDEQIVDRVNESNVGLGASVWSENISRAEKMAMELDVGSAWVNSHFTILPKVPFGGHKDSGFGVENGLSGLKGWCTQQSLWVPKS